MLKNFKYYAGLIDSDGYVGLSFYKSTNETYNIYANVALRLRWDSGQKVLGPLAEEFGVNILRQEKKKPVGEDQLGVTLSGNKAVQFLDQIKKHSVLKKSLIEYIIEMNKSNLTQEELPAVRQKIKELRADRTPCSKSFPSRQWTAGYIDGDGCFATSYDKKYGGVAFKLIIASHQNDPQGVELLCQHYGGVIHIRKDGSLSYVYPLKQKGDAEKFFSGVLPHLKVKRVQADLIQSVLRNGRHLKKNGATPESNLEIHNKLKELKKPNKPQRLNEIGPEG